MLADMLAATVGVVLDPFAGTGERLAELARMVPTARFVGIELQQKWASVTPELVMVGSVLDLPFADESVAAVVTSPTYGSRMADHHDARDASVRNTYRHRHGEPLHPDNSGTLQWGEKYRRFHQVAWAEVYRVLQPDGVLVLNVGDHVRRGQVVPVSSWHVEHLCEDGAFTLERTVLVNTRKLRYGANSEARTQGENVFLLRKEGPPAPAPEQLCQVLPFRSGGAS